ncbi:MAG: efflux RND transporter periplasmic adaptor subunit [Halioglobus sp.]|nr:efflux RND transporter periplasmic adaptor subunit [Halioglobus sp.]
MTQAYKLIYKKKAELNTRKGEIIFLTSVRDASRYSLTPDQYALAKLFDGRRTKTEVLELYRKKYGIELTEENLQEFLDNLEDSGLLERSASILPGSDNVVENLTWARGDTAESSEAEVDSDPEESMESYPPETEDEMIMRKGRRRKRVSTAPNRVTKAGKAGSYTKDVKLLVSIPIGWLMPLARLLTLPIHGRISVVLFFAAAIGALFGLWNDRFDVVRDLKLLMEPLIIAQTLLISMFSVNLAGQLARAGAAYFYSKKVPKFGIALAFNVLPRFYVSLAEHAGLLSLDQRRGIILSALYANVIVFSIASFMWFITKNDGTFLPLLMIGIAILSVVRLVLALNPLSKRGGYYLLSAKLGVPLLRERALFALMGKTLATKPGEKTISPWALRLYGVLVIAWLLGVTALITVVLGGWLEANWGGLGVLIFIGLASATLYAPLKQARLARSKIGKGKRGSDDLRKQQKPTTWTTRAVRLVLLVGLILIGMLPYTYEPGGELVLLPLADSRADVRAQIEAPIEEILVTEGQAVKKGELLARLSDDEEQRNIATVEATIKKLQAELAKAEAGPTKEEIASAKQRVETARVNYQFAKQSAERYAVLSEKGTVSRQEYENSQSKADNSRELVTQASTDLDLLMSWTRPEDIDAIKASIAREEAQLDYYRQRLGYSELRSPIDGVIASGSILTAAGNYLERGDLFAIVADNQHLLGEIKVPQADIGEVRIGAPVRIKFWSFPDREFKGVVQSIAPTADKSDYGKIVRVRTEVENPDGLLKANLTGQAKIVGQEKPVVLVFSRMLVRFIQVELWSWLP